MSDARIRFKLKRKFTKWAAEELASSTTMKVDDAKANEEKAIVLQEKPKKQKLAPPVTLKVFQDITKGPIPQTIMSMLAPRDQHALLRTSRNSLQAFVPRRNVPVIKNEEELPLKLSALSAELARLEAMPEMKGEGVVIVAPEITALLKPHHVRLLFPVLREMLVKISNALANHLDRAISNGQNELATQLIQNGANVNFTPKPTFLLNKPESVLTHAINLTRESVVEVLLQQPEINFADKVEEIKATIIKNFKKLDYLRLDTLKRIVKILIALEKVGFPHEVILAILQEKDYIQKTIGFLTTEFLSIEDSQLYLQLVSQCYSTQTREVIFKILADNSKENGTNSIHSMIVRFSHHEALMLSKLALCRRLCDDGHTVDVFKLFFPREDEGHSVGHELGTKSSKKVLLEYLRFFKVSLRQLSAGDTINFILPVVTGMSLPLLRTHAKNAELMHEFGQLCLDIFSIRPISFEKVSVFFQQENFLSLVAAIGDGKLLNLFLDVLENLYHSNWLKCHLSFNTQVFADIFYYQNPKLLMRFLQLMAGIVLPGNAQAIFRRVASPIINEKYKNWRLLHGILVTRNAGLLRQYFRLLMNLSFVGVEDEHLKKLIEDSVEFTEPALVSFRESDFKQMLVAWRDLSDERLFQLLKLKRPYNHNDLVMVLNNLLAPYSINVTTDVFENTLQAWTGCQHYSSSVTFYPAENSSKYPFVVNILFDKDWLVKHGQHFVKNLNIKCCKIAKLVHDQDRLVVTLDIVKLIEMVLKLGGEFHQFLLKTLGEKKLLRLSYQMEVNSALKVDSQKILDNLDNAMDKKGKVLREKTVIFEFALLKMMGIEEIPGAVGAFSPARKEETIDAEAVYSLELHVSLETVQAFIEKLNRSFATDQYGEAAHLIKSFPSHHVVAISKMVLVSQEFLNRFSECYKKIIRSDSYEQQAFIKKEFDKANLPYEFTNKVDLVNEFGIWAFPRAQFPMEVDVAHANKVVVGNAGPNIR